MTGRRVAGLEGIAPPAPGVSILGAFQRLGELTAAVGVKGADGDTSAFWAQAIPLEAFILAAPIASPAEAVAVLVVATGDVFSALGFQDADELAADSIAAAARATRFLAGVQGLDIAAMDRMPGGPLA